MTSHLMSLISSMALLRKSPTGYIEAGLDVGAEAHGEPEADQGPGVKGGVADVCGDSDISTGVSAAF